jgi:hypothetical protein
MPPLYRLKWSNAEHEYVFSDKERDALLADGLANGKRIPKESGIQRYKGRLDVLTHQHREDLVRRGGVVDGHLPQGAGVVVHRGLPQLLRVHLTETLV